MRRLLLLAALSLALPGCPSCAPAPYDVAKPRPKPNPKPKPQPAQIEHTRIVG